MTAAEIARLEALLEWLRMHAPDCGDNSCLFGGRGKGGMRTNGGCRCYKDVRPDMRRVYVERLLSATDALPELLKAARDAERYRKLKEIAVQKTAWDVYGNGGFWQVGVHSDDSRLSFDEAVDAMKEARRG